ncbi:hypothetical protein NE237_017950 [Protea cynaroides]|uniref:O-methyltransferase C-terminal domain-containing protein n=1 Tax=Protea cynaroides TaxID=273540 RepID=A0A9Q0K8Z7_9MAGN|nr:hypothetical protein NE237_017950 [Protea cynaroides]
MKFLKTTQWDFAAANPEFNLLFNDGLACTSKGVLKAVLSTHREGFTAMGSESVVVDVGGGTGMAVAEIVKIHLHTQGINFDMSHVVDTASQYLGVSHVGGDVDWWTADRSSESSFNRRGLRGVGDDAIDGKSERVGQPIGREEEGENWSTVE